MHSLVSSVRARHEISFSFTLIFKLKVSLTISLLRQFISHYEQRVYLMSAPHEAMSPRIPNARDAQSNSREATPPRVSYPVSIFIDANDSSDLFGGNGNPHVVIVCRRDRWRDDQDTWCVTLCVCQVECMDPVAQHLVYERTCERLSASNLGKGTRDARISCWHLPSVENDPAVRAVFGAVYGVVNARGDPGPFAEAQNVLQPDEINRRHVASAYRNLCDAARNMIRIAAYPQMIAACDALHNARSDVCRLKTADDVLAETLQRRCGLGGICKENWLHPKVVTALEGLFGI